MKKNKIVIYGSTGKMGRSLLDCMERETSLELIGSVHSKESVDPLLARSDVVIDFTAPQASLALLKKCVTSNKALVIGTTGFSKDEVSQIKMAAQEIPIVFSPNYSVGVNALFWLTKKATELLGPEYDSEIIEIHHRYKKDAPSGTAHQLANIIAEARHLDCEKEACHGRFGIIGERPPTEIGIHALRVGDAIGEHTVILGTLGERLELTYRASTRAAYAIGALRAAKWLQDKRPGLYDMQDILGLR